MFRENHDHEQEKLFSPLKDLPAGPEKKLQNHWSAHFYEHVFTQIDEEKFAVLYDDGYSRPNKPVNELVSLEIIKHLRGLSDEELEHAYIFDHLVRNALGKETLGDNICPKTFTNFRRRLMEYEEETGRDLLQEVFEDHRNYLIEEFDIDASTQRMDSTFIEANIKQLSRVDLIAKVVHNFLCDLPEEIVHDLPAGINEFADTENLELSYQLEPDEIQSTKETLAEHAAWLVDRFEDEERYADLESFAHLQRILDEQCYRIPELEDGDLDRDADDDDQDHPGDDGPPGWEPVRNFTSIEEETGQDQASNDTAEIDESEDQQEHVGLKQPGEIGSDAMQNPHDDEATYRRKNGEDYYGYKANWAETCSEDDPFRVITNIQVETNNTEDTDLLEEAVNPLADETGLTDLLVDGNYAGKETEQISAEAGVTQHFSGINGSPVDSESEDVLLAEAVFTDHELVACPQGHTPAVQEYTPDNDRYWGRFDKEICGNCPFRDECFVDEKQEFYSYGFYGRKLEVARHRAKLTDPEMEEFLKRRSGVESLINEVTHKIGKQTKFTGQIKVKNAAIATAIGRNLKRVSGLLETEATAGSAVA